MFDALERETGTGPSADPNDATEEVKQFLDPNTSSSSSESEADSLPPSPIKEQKIRKEKKLPRAVRRRVDRYIKRKLEESLAGTSTEHQSYSHSYPPSTYTDPYSQPLLQRVQYL